MIANHSSNIGFNSLRHFHEIALASKYGKCYTVYMLSTLIHKTLTPQIAPMVYIMMGVSVLIGFFFATGLFLGPGESVLYAVGVLFPKHLWGLVLFCTSVTAEIGFIFDNDALISFGGIAGFMAWLFACIALFMGGFWYVLITVGIFHLLFHGYVVLATSLGYLRRTPIN